MRVRARASIAALTAVGAVLLAGSGGTAAVAQEGPARADQLVAAGHEGGTRHRIQLRGTFRAVGSPSPGTIQDRGTVTGAPFGPSGIELLSTFGAGQRVAGTFRIDSRRGSAFGTMEGTFAISGFEVDIDGVARLTGGTGRYSAISGDGLVAQVHDTLDGQNGTLRLEGFARF